MENMSMDYAHIDISLKNTAEGVSFARPTAIRKMSPAELSAELNKGIESLKEGSLL